MKFHAYVPYSQLELNVIESSGGEIEEFYFSVEELREYCGETDITKITIDGLELDYEDGFIISFDDISEN